MNKMIIPAIILSVVIGVGFSPAMAQTAEDFQNRIITLEKQVADKNAIIHEQVQVIMSIVDGYKNNYKDNNNAIYEPFSLESFPETGGFNPAWLKGEKSKIIDSCNEAQSMGYTNTYCKFIQ